MKPKNRILFSFIMLCNLALLTGLLLAQPQGQAQALWCMDCQGGGSPTTPNPTSPSGGGGGGGGGGTNEPPEPTDPPCDPFYTPPQISANLSLDPLYPITLGQDPDDRGVDVSGITAHAGVRICPMGRAQIISFRIVQVRLAASSIAWIHNTLARKYPGAHVKGTYPFTPSFQVSGLGTPTARLSFHLAPLDPGYYEVLVQAIQTDGKNITATLRIPVYLMESTIIE